METRRQIAEWYTGEINRIESKIITEQEKAKKDEESMSVMVDKTLAELDAAFKEAAQNRRRKNEAFAQSVAASTPSEDQ